MRKNKSYPGKNSRQEVEPCVGSGDAVCEASVDG